MAQSHRNGKLAGSVVTMLRNHSQVKRDKQQAPSISNGYLILSDVSDTVTLSEIDTQEVPLMNSITKGTSDISETSGSGIQEHAITM